MSCDLSLVIPAFNEAKRIAPTLESFHQFLSLSGMRFEIIVVDDGSSDDTVAVVNELAHGLSSVRCIESKPNRGKGHAVRVGMCAAAGDIRVMVDADGSTPAPELPKLVNPIRLGLADIAIGSRYASGASVEVKQPFYRRWWSRLANKVVQRTLVPGIVDTQCGFKAFSGRAADAVFGRAQIDGWAFDLEVLALAKRMNLVVSEVAVHWSDDPRSNINPLGDAVRVFKELIEIRRNLRRGVYGSFDPALASASLTSIPAQ